jgi:hypothetical protein
MKPQKKAEPQSDVNDVTLGSSAIFENQILKLGGGVRQNYLRPVAFRLHFSMGLALSKSTNDFMHPPQARASGRQHSRYLRQAHFITSSKKGLSEPRSVGRIENYAQ